MVEPVASRGRPRDHLLEHLHHVAVVREGLVGLDHRELGVVLVADALVAEVLAELVDLLQPAHDAALEVELGRDPQVEVAVEGVVVGHERPRGGAAVDRLQGRGLDLHEAAVVEEAPHRRDRARAGDEAGAGVGIGHQLEVALAEPGLGVLQTGVLVRRGPQRLGQQRRRVDRHAQLAAPGARDRPAHPEDVPEVEVEERRHRLLAEAVDARPDLDAAAAVVEVEEGDLALPAPGGQPAGHVHHRVAGPARPRDARARPAPRRSPGGRGSARGTGRPRPRGARAPWRAAPRSVPRVHPPARPDQPWWSPAWMSTIW